jgi:sarcosine oxidase subunit alpha
MVDASGTLVDDGVAARISDDHFYITATSSHAQAVVRQLQLYADQLGLDVAIVDRTFQVGALNLAGPHSRRVLGRVTDLDLSANGFPYLAVRAGKVAGVEARLLRVGFVGELGYEIHFPATCGPALWEALMAAGAAEDIQPFGVETQRLLRLEKGHLIFGQDTDGTANPYEVNLGWGVRLSKPRFVGRHSLQVLKPRVERKLIGFKVAQSRPHNAILECHLIIDDGKIGGRVTSVGFSPHCNTGIGLAMVDTALAEVGRELAVRTTDGTFVTVTVVDTPFYDPENRRQQNGGAAGLDTAA